MRPTFLWLVPITLFTILHWSCSPPPPDDEDAGDDQGDGAAAADILVTDPLEEHFVSVRETFDGGAEHTREVPNNQLVLMFDRAVSEPEAEATLDRLRSDFADFALEAVGRIPDLGIYQLEITNDETDAEAAMARLESVRASLEAYPEVETVGCNELLTSEAIEYDDDNSGIEQYNRCPFAVIDYYQAIPIFDQVMPHLSLSDVTVAVIDSGLWVESGQFDDILTRTQFPGLAPGATSADWHPYKHGTNIAMLIAGDDGDGFVNGVGLRLLGERLHLIVGNSHVAANYYGLASTLARARQAVLLGADIVNLSLGQNARGRQTPWIQRTQAQFDRLFSESPQTLFIAAAANESVILDNNDAPPGMPNANLLTVGGHQSCYPQLRAPESCVGPGIELAAPATGIPGLVGFAIGDPQPYILEGNSFGAPLVASIAAIVKSIDPDMTGAELKEFLVDEDHTWPASAEVGGRRVALLHTAGSAILTRAAAVGDVDAMLDAFGPLDNISDPSGYTANRLAGQIDFSITGSYNVTVSLDAPQIEWGPDQINYGLIGMGHQVILKMGNSSTSVMITTTAGFRLNQPYTSGVFITAPLPGAGGQLAAGVDGSTGTFSFSECELTTRSLPLDWFSPDNSGPHQLVFIEVSGSFVGTAQGGTRLSDGEHIAGVSYATGGQFTTAFILVFPEEDTLDYLERHCVGGYLLGAEEE